jgi:hypothetical protein
VLLKKLVSIILLLVYGLSSSGMTIQFHYCCGKLKNISLSAVATKQCGMKHASVGKPCCNDKQVELKLNADQKTEQVAKFVFSAPVVEKQESGIFVFAPVITKPVVPEIFAPPPLQNSLYILHCVYRI